MERQADNNETITRFSVQERLAHNMVALCVLLQVASGMTMFLFNVTGINTDIARDADNTILNFHQMIFFILAFTAILIFVAGLAGVWRESLSVVLSWKRADFIWLTRMPLTAIMKEKELPPADKFNPGQKLWVIIACVWVTLQLASGFVLLINHDHIIALVIHAANAIMLLPMLLGHIYMAAFNSVSSPGLAVLFTGEVKRAWARDRYPLWVERIEEAAGDGKDQDRSRHRRP